MEEGAGDGEASGFGAVGEVAVGLGQGAEGDAVELGTESLVFFRDVGGGDRDGFANGYLISHRATFQTDDISSLLCPVSDEHRDYCRP